MVPDTPGNWLICSRSCTREDATCCFLCTVCVFPFPSAFGGGTVGRFDATIEAQPPLAEDFFGTGADSDCDDGETADDVT